MKQQQVVTGLLFVTGLYFLFRKKPKIEVTATNAQEKTVSYKMTYKDATIADTFKLGDAPQFIPAQDNYFFGAYSKGVGVVELAIGWFEPDGGFKSIATRLVSF